MKTHLKHILLLICFYLCDNVTVNWADSRVTCGMGLWACLSEYILVVLTEVGRLSHRVPRQPLAGSLDRIKRERGPRGGMCSFLPDAHLWVWLDSCGQLLLCGHGLPWCTHRHPGETLTKKPLKIITTSLYSGEPFPNPSGH